MCGYLLVAFVWPKLCMGAQPPLLAQYCAVRVCYGCVVSTETTPTAPHPPGALMVIYEIHDREPSMWVWRENDPQMVKHGPKPIFASFSRQIHINGPPRSLISYTPPLTPPPMRALGECGTVGAVYGHYTAATLKHHHFEPLALFHCKQCSSITFGNSITFRNAGATRK
jgi:hypothetical protein